MYDLRSAGSFSFLLPYSMASAPSKNVQVGCVWWACCSRKRLPDALQVFPLEVVRRRMQTLAAEGMSQKGVMVARQAVLDIWGRERLRGFYAGMLPNTIQVSAPSSPPYPSFERFSAAAQPRQLRDCTEGMWASCLL